MERDNGDFSTHDVNEMITKGATFKQKEFYETMYVSKNTYFVNLLYKHLLKIEKTNKQKNSMTLNSSLKFLNAQNKLE